ncbi:MAG: hypothetical protein K0B10_00460 [Vicingaceae bacterium]|nr:hypothetical protein [Vicingaceae bacterium]
MNEFDNLLIEKSDTSSALYKGENEPQYFSRSITNIDTNSLDQSYNKLSQKYNFTPPQNEVLIKVILELHRQTKCQDTSATLFPKIKMMYGGENEVLMTFSSIKGVHLLSIDEFGDSFSSFSGYKLQDSFSEFYDYDDLDIRKLVLEFLMSGFEVANN